MSPPSDNTGTGGGTPDDSQVRRNDPRDPGHPDHELYHSIRKAAADLYTKHHVHMSADQIERISASVLMNSKRDGLAQVGGLVVCSNPSTRQEDPMYSIAAYPQARNTFPPHNSFTDVQQALRHSPEETYQQQRTAQLAQQQTQTIQEERHRNAPNRMPDGPGLL